MKRLALLALAFATIAAAPAAKRPVAIIHHPIACNAGAQAAFDRGLLDYYAYNPEAAEHAFYTAADLDKSCAMAWWGIAMSTGPNINVPATDDRDEQAREAINRARGLEASAGPEDTALIDAAVTRFDGDPKASLQAKLDAYRDAMKPIAQRYPGDPDAAALYGDAMLSAYSNVAYNAFGGTAAQQATLVAQAAALLPYYQAELVTFPQHIGLLHYIIHVAQDANDSKAAVTAAVRLAAFSFPDEDSHLTHMPGHTFFDVGMYGEALAVGNRSLAMDAADLACCHPGYYSSTRYYHGHNVNFVLYALTELGQFDAAIAVAKKEGGTSFLARQFAVADRWNDVLALPKSPGDGPQVAYARAIAYAHLGDAANAGALRDMLATIKNPYYRAFVGAMVKTIDGEIAIAAHDDATALPLLQAASASLAVAEASQTSETAPLYFYSPNMALANLAARMGKSDIERSALQAELVSSPKAPAAVAMLAAMGAAK